MLIMIQVRGDLPVPVAGYQLKSGASLDLTDKHCYFALPFGHHSDD